MSDVQQIIDKNKETLIIPDGIAIKAKDKNIIMFNEAASRITGYSEDEVIGNTFEFIFEKNLDIDHQRSAEYLRDHKQTL